MSPLQRITLAFSLGSFLTAGGCGEDPQPTTSQQQDGAVTAASDAGGHDAGGASDSGASNMDAGNVVAVDGGAPNADSGALTSNDSGTADAGRDGGSDGAVSGMNDAGPTGDAGSGGTFTLSSPAFENKAGCAKDMATPCAVFPEENVSYMQEVASTTENISPELNWTGVPAGTKSFAVVLQDLTNGLAHWVLWNIAGTATKLEKNVPKSSAMPAMPAGAQQSNASFADGNGYIGPGSRCNVYEFVVYALSRPMFSPAPATDAGQVRTQLQALGADILGTASLRGRANYMMMCQ